MIKSYAKIEDLIEESLKDLSKAQKFAIANGIGGAGVGAIIGNSLTRAAGSDDDDVLLATLLGAGGLGAAKAAASYHENKDKK